MYGKLLDGSDLIEREGVASMGAAEMFSELVRTLTRKALCGVDDGALAQAALDKRNAERHEEFLESKAATIQFAKDSGMDRVFDCSGLHKLKPKYTKILI